MPSFANSPAAARPGETANTLRLLGYLVMAVVLMMLDRQAGWLAYIRAQADRLTEPVWALAGLPGRIGVQVKENLSSRNQLLRENRELRSQLLISNARLTRLSIAVIDNNQLRELLGVVERSGLDVQLVPILNIDLTPSQQRLVLNAGTREGVHIGQPVIDAGGVLGQVIAATSGHSTVLLLTDPDHAIPVIVARNGVRLIVYGNGSALEIRDVPLSTDVKVGDHLVTSGLGGGFPAGFPVGEVTALRPDDSQAFLVGGVAPAAHLDRGRDVLLLRVESEDDALDVPAASDDASEEGETVSVSRPDVSEAGVRP